MIFLNIEQTKRVIEAAKGKAWRSILPLLFCFGTTAATGSQSTVYLRAQHIDVDQRSGLSTYRGDVRLRRGRLSFNADKAIVRQNNGGIESLTAYGNPVVIRTRNPDDGEITTITGRQLDYVTKTNSVAITGKVVTRQGSDVVNSSKIVYRIDDDYLTTESANKTDRVKAVLRIKRRADPSARPGTNFTQ